MRGYVEQRARGGRRRGDPAPQRGLRVGSTSRLPRNRSRRKQAALAVIAYFAKLFCGRMLDASQAAADIGVWLRSLDQLV